MPPRENVTSAPFQHHQSQLLDELGKAAGKNWFGKPCKYSIGQRPVNIPMTSNGRGELKFILEKLDRAYATEIQRLGQVGGPSRQAAASELAAALQSIREVKNDPALRDIVIPEHFLAERQQGIL
jgi:hypothetical protein